MSLTFYFAPMSTASITEAVLAELGVRASACGSTSRRATPGSRTS
jgi:hypothetical protein